jgi:hypothetical protein
MTLIGPVGWSAWLGMKRQVARALGMRTAMSKQESPPPQQAGRIKDARGRRVTQLDPVATYVLRQCCVIEADVLRAIAHEKGVRIAGKERVSLILGVVGVLTVAGLLVQSIIAGDFGSEPWARTSSLAFFCFLPWLTWNRLKQSRFGKIAAAMLKYSRCPHCGYDLRLLPTDPQDGATVCPECGCAWRLTGQATASDETPPSAPS